MEEDLEASILPIIIVAIFLLLIIGVVIWFVMSRRVVGPAPTPIPVAPLTPATNTSNAASPPASVPVVRTSARCDDDSTRSDDTQHDSSGEILVYSHSFRKEDGIAFPEAGIISIAYSSDRLYSCTESAIYVHENGSWDLIGSVEETICTIEGGSGELRVRTSSGDYKLQEHRGSSKMSRCRAKRQSYNGDSIYLSGGSRLVCGGSEIARDVTCFCVRSEDSLAYMREGRLHLVDERGVTSKSSRIGSGVDSICMSDDYIYLLSSYRDESESVRSESESRVSGSGSSE